MENASELIKLPFDKSIGHMELFDTKTRKELMHSQFCMRKYSENIRARFRSFYNIV